MRNERLQGLLDQLDEAREEAQARSQEVQDAINNAAQASQRYDSIVRQIQTEVEDENDGNGSGELSDATLSELLSTTGGVKRVAQAVIEKIVG